LAVIVGVSLTVDFERSSEEITTVAVFISYDTLTGSSARTPHAWTQLQAEDDASRLSPPGHAGSSKLSQFADALTISVGWHLVPPPALSRRASMLRRRPVTR
jgi:hypothetical protein